MSSFGRVRSVTRKITMRNQYTSWSHTVEGRVLSTNNDTSGYPSFIIRLNGKRKTVRVHRVLAETFMPIKDSQQMQVNHIDGDKTNNVVTNLEWVTPSENQLHAIKRGLKRRLCGENNPNNKLRVNQVIAIKELLRDTKLSQQSIADIVGTTQITVSNIKTGKTWNEIKVDIT